MRARMSILLVPVLLAAAATGRAQQPLDYLIRVEDPISRLYHVEAVLPATGAATLVSLPTWTPGAYHIDNYARYVRDLSATAGDGTPLRWDKIDKDTWRIHSGGARHVRVSFNFFADNATLAGSVLRPDFGFFNGTNLFVYPEKRYDFPARVRFELPEGWRIATELIESGEPGVYLASDYHELVDNPTFVGHFAIDSALADGVWTRLAVYPADAIPEAGRRQMLEALRKIADYAHDLFGEPPYERYTTLVYLYEGQPTGGGGLEHANSHLDIGPADMLQSEQAIEGWTYGLFSHEYYHAWNVKRIRPAEMWPYDYEAEQYTPLLWISEGFTSYYGPLILARTGLTDEEAFWGSMQGAISAVESQPYQESVEDVSLSTWISPMPISGGYYYSKGSVIGLLLDIKIRDATDNRHSLDDVMYRLYHDHYERSSGFSTEDFLHYVGEYIGREEMQRFHSDHIDGRVQLPYEEVLALAGMSFAMDTIVVPLLGVFADYSQEGLVMIDDVVPGSSAVMAGLQAGDRLLRVGHIEVAGQGWAEQFRQIYADSTGVPFTVEFMRNGERMTGNANISTDTRFEYRIEPLADASERQLVIRRGLVKGVTR
jgi:predicted metalloprotease with PDZ domain